MEEKKVSCPACGAEMEQKLRNLSIGADGGGGLFAALVYEQYTVDLYACPNCGKVELYTAGFQKEQSKQEEQVVCPVCGREHSTLIGCPTCALRDAQSGRMPRTPDRAKSGKKPPWEK